MRRRELVSRLRVKAKTLRRQGRIVTAWKAKRFANMTAQLVRETKP